ncbi:MAG: hypothetical protein EZS28_001035 [Streblomastix strix]|uniref:Uncharacterized protein n=1 Tax=Streblomastix strix TaxID=222440 RepID=A0A5J4X8Q5_9EUKA|nr:MAG: hypothetical protein EZS28_001035 [Streblomastix strix]
MVYSIIVPTMDAELVRSSHRNGVRGVAFAQSTSEIFATCGYSGIRLQRFRSVNEHARIEVPNVSSVTKFQNSLAIVSGGSEGQVRLWKLNRDDQQLVATMKEHRMAVTAAWVTQDDLECVSSGSDGYILTYSLTRHIRLKQMIKTANFEGVD